MVKSNIYFKEQRTKKCVLFIFSLVGNPVHFGTFDRMIFTVILHLLLRFVPHCCSSGLCEVIIFISKSGYHWSDWAVMRDSTDLNLWKSFLFCLFFSTKDCEGDKKRVINCWTYKRVDDDSFKCPSLCHCLHVLWASFVTVKNLLICARSLFGWKSHEMYFALQNEQK